MDINGRQNSELNLKRLAAYRQLYSEAKNMTYIQFCLVGLAVVVLAIIGNAVSSEYGVYIGFLTFLCIFLNEIFLTKRIESRRLTAAIIQEKFDCDVLQIPPNTIKHDYGNMLETIQERSNKYLAKHNNFDLLMNWYPKFSTADSNLNRIICQNTNCWWDQKLRKKYSGFLISMVITIFVLLFLLSIYKGITLGGFMQSVIFPIAPVGFFVYRIDRDNKKTIRNLNDLKIKIDAIIVKLKERESYSDEKIMNDIRNLQDTIFDNRANSPQIPDRFYFKYRDQCEETAQEITKELEKLITS